MDKKVVRKMIKRIESVPESYDQRAWFVRRDNSAPCGTVACLAGEAVICSAKTVKAGIKLAFDYYDEIPSMAARILGLPESHSVFVSDGSGWPAPYRDYFKNADSEQAKAQVVVSYLKEALNRGTMIWETENTNAN
jgi:hypothetical protein